MSPYYRLGPTHGTVSPITGCGASDPLVVPWVALGVRRARAAGAAGTRRQVTVSPSALRGPRLRVPSRSLGTRASKRVWNPLFSRQDTGKADTAVEEPRGQDRCRRGVPLQHLAHFNREVLR